MADIVQAPVPAKIGLTAGVVAPSQEDANSDDELELALPEVPLEDSEHELEQPKRSTDDPAPALHVPTTSTPSLPPRPFMPPPNPSIPQDLAVIAELVNSYQAVGSLPPLTISAAEKRKQVEASIKARMEALKKDKLGAGEGTGRMDSAVPPISGEEEQARAIAEDAKMRSELDQFVGLPSSSGPAVDITVNADSSDSDSSSEYESDSSSSSEEEDGDGDAHPEFIFSDSPAPSPRKRPMTFEVIEDDEEPMSADPIVSANEAPLPPVPQPPFERIPDGEGLSLAGEVVSWMREKRVEGYWAGREASSQGQARVVADASGSRAEVPKADGEMEVQDEAGEEVKEETAKDGEGVEEGEVEEPAVSTSVVDLPVASTSKTAEVPRFSSSGTIVIRAMQERPGQEGWLEEGSVVCYPDGRVLGFVSDTFGPLTSPFYSVRLPPPPFPLPTNSSLVPGTRLSYPTNPQYRSFVNMLAVQDPRFKGSDASNVHDEEVGEEEAEWSDDEMEAEAKKRKKNNKRAASTSELRGGWAPGGPPMGAGGGGSSFDLPMRPHFDYVPEDASDAASFYGDGADMEDGGVSEAGSSVSRRPAPMPYDLDEPPKADNVDGEKEKGKEHEQGGGGKRGRGQGRQRGGGRESDRGGGAGGGRGGRGRGGGGEGGRGGRGGRGGAREDRGGKGGGRGARGGADGARGGGRGRGGAAPPPPIRPTFNLPQKPTFDSGPPLDAAYAAQAGLPPPHPSLPTPPMTFTSGFPMNMPQPIYTPVDQYRPQHQQQQQHYQPPHQQSSPFVPAYPIQHQQQYGQYPPFQAQQQQSYPQPGFAYQGQGHGQGQQQQQQQLQQQQNPAGPGGAGGPAINPRFAAQYQQMQFMSHLAAWGQQGQGQGPQGSQGQGGQGGSGGQGGYGG